MRLSQLTDRSVTLEVVVNEHGDKVGLKYAQGKYNRAFLEETIAVPQEETMSLLIEEWDLEVTVGEYTAGLVERIEQTEKDLVKISADDIEARKEFQDRISKANDLLSVHSGKDNDAIIRLPIDPISCALVPYRIANTIMYAIQRDLRPNRIFTTGSSTFG